MIDYPVIMSAPMVPATLREVREPGTGKTETRRLAWTGRKAANGEGFWPSQWQRVKAGDRLWVRERLCSHSGFGFPLGPMPHTDFHGSYVWSYFADSVPAEITGGRPSIHCPRWASRLTLIVTSTKIERLQDITEDDARAEGVEPAVAGVDHDGSPLKTYRTGFVRIWGELHGTDSWLANPWVIAVSFRPVLANIDSLEAAA